MKGIVIVDAQGSTDTPRAHLVNPFTMECLRDIGLEDDATRMSVAPELIGAFRYCRSLLGQEWGRVLHWEGVPEIAAQVKSSTPSRWIDLPQSYMEPILVNNASHNGFAVRFSTQLESVEKAPSGEWLCRVQDRVREDSYVIRTKFLFGADGGHSTVARFTNAKFTSMPSQGVACNILLSCDVTHLIEGRQAQLHTIVNPTANSRLGIGGIIRMIRPWHEWMLVTVTPGIDISQDPFKNLKPDSPELVAYVREALGLDENSLTKDIPLKIHRLDPWVIRETVADHLDPDNNVFLLGDAAHRHPPIYGLGSNTCVQDAYNLAWKVAFVARGLAGPGLLQSYDGERQPVAAQLVREANAGLRTQHVPLWHAMGLLGQSPEEGSQVQPLLNSATEAGEEQRRKLHEAFEVKGIEGKSLGLCGNQWYTSNAIYLDDETGPRPQIQGDPIVELQVCTYPGTRLPHAWLDVPARRRAISTHDLAGKGAFCLFTGYGGDAWQDAAATISKKTGIPINSYKIGFGLEWQDIERQWYARRGVEDSGCVLVRPDRYVAWRSVKRVDDCEGKLSRVLDRILSREMMV
ncbi:hypothetical protein M406DRAFT_296739 [Cryphonectria parasitica EP155]|uniref:FAD-binding domain-containing protein n=1 Tax=Cryphonectria parasitica (strain ATCC 38755 / EP155) TaxID=660469 RepID=A0A9P4XV30_CRYP1|nr:uncharacterized protein M406DRAFT_296739 [Cryphonectria parasitica EP155]KAF3761160.1 hypothetical protein M406DRAFT_296739 [Cryphonectria parasitica EP155]